MTRDDVIRMVRESCDTDKADAWHGDFWTLTQEELERFAALVAAHKREECEDRVVDLFTDMEMPYLPDITRAIRARGTQ